MLGSIKPLIPRPWGENTQISMNILLGSFRLPSVTCNYITAFLFRSDFKGKKVVLVLGHVPFNKFTRTWGAEHGSSRDKGTVQCCGHSLTKLGMQVITKSSLHTANLPVLQHLPLISIFLPLQLMASFLRRQDEICSFPFKQQQDN